MSGHPQAQRQLVERGEHLRLLELMGRDSTPLYVRKVLAATLCNLALHAENVAELGRAGTVGALGPDHPLLMSLRNLRRWYATDGMGEWLHELRLFSLTMNGYSLEEGKALAESNHAALVAAGIVKAGE